VKTLEEIKRILSQHREELRRQYKVTDIGIFGSVVRGEQKKRSDVDVLVEFAGPVSLLGLAGLANYLEGVIGTKVDVVPREDIRPELKETVLKEVVYL